MYLDGWMDGWMDIKDRNNLSYLFDLKNSSEKKSSKRIIRSNLKQVTAFVSFEVDVFKQIALLNLPACKMSFPVGYS